MITIVDYNPLWPQMFKEEKNLLSSCIGKWALKIEHIGSTSVEGLGAKPIIDIVVGVETLKASEKDCIRKLEKIGYTYLPEFEKLIPERRFFRKYTEEGGIKCQIHLVEEKSDIFRNQILFREYLRNNPKEAKAYEKEKKRLAPLFEDSTKYAKAKTDFVEESLEKAEIWIRKFST